MPRGCSQKGPANWNTLFNYELECQRVKCSPGQSSNTCFVLFISVTLGRAEDDDLGKLKTFSSLQEEHSRMHQAIVPQNSAQQACFHPQIFVFWHTACVFPPQGAFTTVRIFTFSILIHKADGTKPPFPKTI